ncbi:hypothetical protein BpHYR1_021034 [Brachionus plicatilis]|uniref:Uncharacterized protein n=1 Tax=Brachionus plicatilis TaxID=10195 RepID=A0A3M7R1H9_BRAPC|nr:hypothetical protein BpHYR1_021034 [Brachionus plicatilis]
MVALISIAEYFKMKSLVFKREHENKKKKTLLPDKIDDLNQKVEEHYQNNEDLKKEIENLKKKIQSYMKG